MILIRIMMNDYLVASCSGVPAVYLGLFKGLLGPNSNFTKDYQYFIIFTIQIHAL